jgi:hypothetical protein
MRICQDEKIMTNLEYFLAIAQDNLLSFKKFKYLKLATFIIVVSIILYAVDNPVIKPNGGTWLGYGLGTVGAILILWLLAFGIRKRAYNSNLGTLRGWLSAHVYLGIALVFVATLHSGFEFGKNIHTLAYLLTLVVVLSGFFGLYFYLRNPSLMGSLLSGKTLQEHGQILREIDEQCRKLALNMTPEIQAIVLVSSNGKIFSRYWQRFTGKNSSCETQKAIDSLEHDVLDKLYRRSSRSEKALIPADRRGSDILAKVQEIYTLQFSRLQQLVRIREYVRLKSWTECWLLFHVPFSFALLGVLIAHVVSVFFYW